MQALAINTSVTKIGQRGEDTGSRDSHQPTIGDSRVGQHQSDPEIVRVRLPVTYAHVAVTVDSR